MYINKRVKQWEKRLEFLRNYKPADYCYHFQDFLSWNYHYSLSKYSLLYCYYLYEKDEHGFFITMVMSFDKDRIIKTNLTNMHIVNTRGFYNDGSGTCSCVCKISRDLARKKRQAMIEAKKISLAIDNKSTHLIDKQNGWL